jgi:hypothetical protein
VVSALELGDLVAARVRASEPDDRLHALGARWQEADSLHARHVPHQAIYQLDLALGRAEIGHAFLERLAHRAHDGRMSVTVNERPGTDHEIDVFVAVPVVEPRPAGAADVDRMRQTVLALPADARRHPFASALV